MTAALHWLPLPRALGTDPRWLCLSSEALRVALLLLLRADDDGAVARVGYTAGHVLDAVVGDGSAAYLDELVDAGVLRVERRRLVLPDVAVWRATCTPGRTEAPAPAVGSSQPVRRTPPSASREAARERKRQSRLSLKAPVTTPVTTPVVDVTTPVVDVTTPVTTGHDPCHEAVTTPVTTGHDPCHEAVTTPVTTLGGEGREGKDSEKEREKIETKRETEGARVDVTTPGHEAVTTPPAVVVTTSGALALTLSADEPSAPRKSGASAAARAAVAAVVEAAAGRVVVGPAETWPRELCIRLNGCAKNVALDDWRTLGRWLAAGALAYRPQLDLAWLASSDVPVKLPLARAWRDAGEGPVVERLASTNPRPQAARAHPVPPTLDASVDGDEEMQRMLQKERERSAARGRTR